MHQLVLKHHHPCESANHHRRYDLISFRFFYVGHNSFIRPVTLYFVFFFSSTFLLQFSFPVHELPPLWRGWQLEELSVSIRVADGDLVSFDTSLAV